MCSGMAGCLVSAGTVTGLLGPLLLISWIASSWKVAWVHIRWIGPVTGLRLDADDIALEMSGHPNIWTDGCREDFSLSMGLKWLALVFICLAFESAVWGVAEELGNARLERCR